MWYEGDMFLGGLWYKCLLGQKGQNTSYMLLTNSPPTFVYSHLVNKAKFSMLPSAFHKGNPRFSMPSNTRERLILALEEREIFDQNS
jgi:hypothetical protein